MSYLLQNPQKKFEKQPAFPDFASPLSNKSFRDAEDGLAPP